MIIKERYWNDIGKALDSIPKRACLYGKKVLITGATGMLCSTVVDLLLYMNKYLEANIDIYVGGRDKGNITERFGQDCENGLHFVPYDAVGEGEFWFPGEIDYIIHGASNATPATFIKEPAETILANVLGLNRVLRLALKKNITRLLYISSSEVYGRNESRGPYGEADYGYVDILDERAGYPLSKRTGEALCIAYNKEYNVDVVIARPGHIYGPTIRKTDNRASAEFTRKAAAKENIIMKSAGNQLRSYCHVIDCATAILTILLNGKDCNAYNISNPKSICTIKQIAEAIAKRAKVDVIIESATEEEKKGYNLMDNSSLQSHKLEELGWVPRFSLEEGVDNTISCLE